MMSRSFSKPWSGSASQDCLFSDLRYPESVGRERSGTGQRVLVCQFQFPTKCKFQICDSSVCCVEHGRTMESFCGLSSGRCCPRQTQTRFKAELQSRIEAPWSQGCDRDSCAL